MTGASARPRAGRPLVIAHRGDTVSAPEQTLEACERAVELGAEMIEADVRRTRDGALVLLHDETVDRTTDGAGALSDLTFEETRRLDAGAWFSPRFAGARIPSLDELFELAERRRVPLCLEVKGKTAEERESLACTVAGLVRERARLGEDVLASFDHQALLTASRLVDGLRCAPERLPERGESVAGAVVEQAVAIGAPIVQHHHADLSSSTVEQVHAAGIQVWGWPPKTRDEIERVLALGVDGVMGGDVATIVATL